jgi:hypothetical protein
MPAKGPQLNQQDVLDQQVHAVLAHDHVMAEYSHAKLLWTRIDFRPRFKCQRILIDLFQKSGPKRVEHGKRTADHAPRQIFSLSLFACFACIAFLHLR